ncbi:enoyl-CoA hydratase [Elizabethkingia argentiflava]|uniref:Enoyl-CoA hydratase n=1 Tax=Elizabethkingia argenteiflava TaxID=2681556 RepID=A0A845PZY0_9FLAO|nr:enoyl-CoA hydratase-related protein [Elizabethkingia argenteiflava]NAW51997.1 enoyl-CoA hydratase [Elizabethkingia argenteiflava]
MIDSNVKINRESEILIIEINRPKSLNALNSQTLLDINKAISEAEENADVKVIIITGSGDKAFVAGADIKEFADYKAPQGEEMAKRGHTLVFDKIENLKKPVIAAINGFALGGGLELALACHIRYASETSKLGLPEVTLGLIPGYGGTQRLPKLVGKGLANEIILSAKMISAQKAKEIGLVNEIFPLSELMNKTKELASIIAKNSPLAISKAIQSVNASDTKNGFETEIKSFAQLFELEDKKEGVAAFLEKRKPNFS